MNKKTSNTTDSYLKEPHPLFFSSLKALEQLVLHILLVHGRFLLMFLQLFERVEFSAADPTDLLVETHDYFQMR